MLGEIDFAKLSDAQIDGLKKILNKLGSEDGAKYPFSMYGGAVNELLDIIKHFDNIVDIQKRVAIEIREGILVRIYDYTLKVSGAIVNFDKKAWAPDTIKKWLIKSAEADFIVPGEVNAGQLFKDLVALV